MLVGYKTVNKMLYFCIVFHCLASCLGSSSNVVEYFVMEAGKFFEGAVLLQ